MSKKIFYSIIIFNYFLISTCEKADILDKEPVYIYLNEKSKSLVNSSNSLGFDLFRKINSADENSEKNISISPMNVSSALAMIYNGAGGDTKLAMSKALGYNNLEIDEINIYNKQINEALFQIDRNVSVFSGNSIWYRNNYVLAKDFIQVNKDFYNAQVTSLNFADPSAINVINNWVALNTNNQIKSIIDHIDSNDIMFLFNAIYYKGDWKYQFDPINNPEMDFVLSNNKSVKVVMMAQSLKLKTLLNDEIQMIELPYGQGNWVMDLVLPNNSESIDNLIEKLDNQSWNTLLNSLNNLVDVNVFLPRFRFEFESDLKNYLSEFGMSIINSESISDFSSINSTNQISISAIKYKVQIEVDESGIEAAKTSSIDTTNSGNRRNIIFNRPFVFIIREISTGNILFIGKIENPAK